MTQFSRRTNNDFVSKYLGTIFWDSKDFRSIKKIKRLDAIAKPEMKECLECTWHRLWWPPKHEHMDGQRTVTVSRTNCHPWRWHQGPGCTSQTYRISPQARRSLETGGRHKHSTLPIGFFTISLGVLVKLYWTLFPARLQIKLFRLISPEKLDNWQFQLRFIINGIFLWFILTQLCDAYSCTHGMYIDTVSREFHKGRSFNSDRQQQQQEEVFRTRESLGGASLEPWEHLGLPARRRGQQQLVLAYRTGSTLS